MKLEDRINVVEFVDDVNNGVILSDLCKKYNSTQRTIKKCAERLGCTIQKQKKFSISDDELFVFIKFLQEHGKAKTAKKYNTTISSITWFTKTHNIQVDTC